MEASALRGILNTTPVIYRFSDDYITENGGSSSDITMSSVMVSDSIRLIHSGLNTLSEKKVVLSTPRVNCDAQVRLLDGWIHAPRSKTRLNCITSWVSCNSRDTDVSIDKHGRNRRIISETRFHKCGSLRLLITDFTYFICIFTEHFQETWEDGAKLMSALKNASLEGISGDISFSESGVTTSTTYRVVNFQGRGFVPVGTWLVTDPVTPACSLIISG